MNEIQIIREELKSILISFLNRPITDCVKAEFSYIFENFLEKYDLLDLQYGITWSTNSPSINPIRTIDIMTFRYLVGIEL